MLQKRRLWIIHLCIALLCFSWMLPATRILWEQLDHVAFYTFNCWISHQPLIQKIWAVFNISTMDWVHDIVMLSFFIVYIFVRRAGRLYRACQTCLCVCLFACIILCVNRGIFEYVKIRRPSPTLVHDDAILLSAKNTGFQVKDRSRKSYPGDHGTTALIFLFQVCVLMTPPARWLAFLYSLFIMLPRLVIGSHWVTDIIMGSLPIAFIPLSWYYFSPLAHLCTRALAKAVNPHAIIPNQL